MLHFISDCWERQEHPLAAGSASHRSLCWSQEVTGVPFSVSPRPVPRNVPSVVLPRESRRCCLAQRGWMAQKSSSMAAVSQPGTQGRDQVPQHRSGSRSAFPGRADPSSIPTVTAGTASSQPQHKVNPQSCSSLLGMVRSQSPTSGCPGPQVAAAAPARWPMQPWALSHCCGTHTALCKSQGLFPDWAPSTPPKNNLHPLKILINDSPAAAALVQCWGPVSTSGCWGKEGSRSLCPPGSQRA